ncbi:MAG: PDZ domain-containing protein [Salinibacter sp.]|uniref:S41 family peptidase n=1 Tax=Salinibacter sp. TaxID=2065818 RepID=UPI002FC2E62E
MLYSALRHCLVVALVAALVSPAAAQDATQLLRQPTVSPGHIVFAHAGELWRVGHDGGDATRLTSFPGVASHPRLSPDGEHVAFSGEYNGQTDVYVVPVDGGTPERLTWHPGTDEVQGWAPDGDRVLFTSGRDSAPASYSRFWTVSREGGTPSPLAIPRADVGRYGPDGERMVYQPIERWQDHWRGYRGGQTHPLWVIDLDDYGTTEIPFEGGIDTRPLWVGDTIYFVSDRTDRVRNVHAYDVERGTVQALTSHTEFDVKTMGAAEGTLVYEQGGRLHRLDLETEESTPLDITVQGDFPWTQAQWTEVGGDIMNANLSPTGVRAVFGARGEIFTVPAEEGDWRNLSGTPAQADRFPAWSPDGSQVAWFSDRNGEYQLMIGPQDGQDEPRAIDLPPSFYYRPQWSPDGSHLLFTDADRTLWVLEVESEALTKVDYDLYAHPQRSLNPEWSPDGDWIAYAKRMHNQFRTIYAYSLERDTSLALTNGMADAVHPAWDESGDYLYFMASTDYGLNTGWLDMSSYERDVERGLYLAVLDADTPSPLLPESDEEPVGGQEEADAETENGEEESDVTIDPDGLDQRILSLDVPVSTYSGLYAATEGTLFFGETGGDAPGLQIHRYRLGADEAQPYLGGVTQFAVSHDGQKALYQARGQWGIVETAGNPSAGDGAIDVSGMEMKVDPTAEWEQLFEEAWRLYRDYLYVDNYHGLDWDTIRTLYEPWLDDVHHRADLNYLIANMIGELSLGHTYVGGGDMPEIEGPGTGLLGADLEAENGRYRFARIYDGESWNPDLRAPLRAPGLDVSEGDYLIAVNGTALTADMNPYRLFEGQVDRQVTLLVNDAPTREGAQEVTVVPVSSEAGLRTQAWVEDNRRRVAEASDGQLGYVWVPNTSQAGYENFNRYYFSQQDRDGIIIDERFNGGGSAADYMIDVMARDLHGFFNNPIGDRDPFTTPGAGIWGPKVMVTNEAAGSGGDLLPYMFKREDLGPTVGRTTWGGLVGIWDTPPLIDGGYLTVPRGGFYDRNGEWAVENEGVTPDIQVTQQPRAVINGADPQLDRAVEAALERLSDESPVLPEPAPPTPAPRGQQ